ncbi:hypothetical protein CEXT_457711 [Caerostris extrusa]|uniref:Uncharacterized protein n=1 Tax=Caerostris extrusa TaxID=172846 RepID=A0AAV4VTX9_CAEEX|nr:hypothetical protein CEXT_457711 [Caerostris extrusa]
MEIQLLQGVHKSTSCSSLLRSRCNLISTLSAFGSGTLPPPISELIHNCAQIPKRTPAHDSRMFTDSVLVFYQVPVLFCTAENTSMGKIFSTWEKIWGNGATSESLSVLKIKVKFDAELFVTERQVGTGLIQYLEYRFNRYHDNVVLPLNGIV